MSSISGNNSPSPIGFTPVSAEETDVMQELIPFSRDTSASDGSARATPYSNPAHNPVLKEPSFIHEDDRAPLPSETELANNLDEGVYKQIQKNVSDKNLQKQYYTAYLIGEEESINNPAVREMVAEFIADYEKATIEKYNLPAGTKLPRNTDENRRLMTKNKKSEILKELAKHPKYATDGKLNNAGFKALNKLMSGTFDDDPALQEINKAVIKSMGLEFKTDSSSIIGEIALDFEAAFHTSIKDLPEQEQKELNFLLKTDTSHPKIADHVKAAKAAIEAKWGYTGAPPTERYTLDYSMNGNYGVHLQVALATHQPPLKPGEAEYVMRYLEAKLQGKDLPISQDLRSIASAVNATALAKTQAEFGATKTWLPDAALGFIAISSSTEVKLLVENQVLANAIHVRMQAMPNSPEKTQMLELLKIISEALAKAQALLFIISAANSAKDAEISNNQKAIIEEKAAREKALAVDAQAQRKEEIAQQKEIAEQQKKDEDMQLAMIFIGVAAILVSGIVAALTFGAGAALVGIMIGAVMMILASVKSGEESKEGQSLSCIGFVMNEMNEAIDEMSPEMAIFIRVLVVVTVIALAVACRNPSIGAVLQAMMPLIMGMFAEGQFVAKLTESAGEAAGMDENSAPWVKAMVSALVMIMIIVIQIVAGRGRASASAAKGAGKIADGAAELSTFEKFARAMKTPLFEKFASLGAKGQAGIQAGLTAVEAGGVAGQMAIAGIKYEMHMELRDIEERLADLTEAIGEKEKVIEDLKALIKLLRQMLQMLSGDPKEFTDRATAMEKNLQEDWQAKTSMMTNLYQSG